MNILIVGNGFDLSHYLPTKYDHFMDVMAAIEESKNESMNFDELFSKCREDWFIAKTKEYYLTENIVLEKDQLSDIRNLLAENCWYKYFKNHVREVKTWIDFEQKIEEILLIFSQFLDDITSIESSRYYFKYFEIERKDGLRLRENHLEILCFFQLIDKEAYERILPSLGDHRNKQKPVSYRNNINSKFCYGNDLHNGFNPLAFLSFMNEQLDNFIEIFNLYLSWIVSKIKNNKDFRIDAEGWYQPNQIYSFNYTNTFNVIYDNIPIEFLHGRCGKNQNMVLGVSDLESDSLRSLKAYGFTKYHQKLFKDTDYLFLDAGSPVMKRIQGSRNMLAWEDTNIIIWGHSLDSSDREYITSIFSLNDEKDLGVRVIIFYFNSQAKFSLLNNLLAILGKDKIEHWMKKGWLKFEKNPEIHFGAQEEVDQEKEAS